MARNNNAEKSFWPASADARNFVRASAPVDSSGVLTAVAQ
jgi:hypothetical protein